jgi:hypothetical protein
VGVRDVPLSAVPGSPGRAKPGRSSPGTDVGMPRAGGPLAALPVAVRDGETDREAVRTWACEREADREGVTVAEALR